MLAGLEVPPAVEAGRVIKAVLADLLSDDHRGTVADSPPGAGKSTRVVRAALNLAAPGEWLIIIAQTNEQFDDLVDRLARTAAELRIGRLSAADDKPSERVRGHEGVWVAAEVADLGGPPVIMGTAARWTEVARALGRERPSTRCPSRGSDVETAPTALSHHVLAGIHQRRFGKLIAGLADPGQPSRNPGWGNAAAATASTPPAPAQATQSLIVYDH
ncbi:hypothetical protein [Micromonospora psammae]|uniref:hypothetical protein n=1 Tax=Micromonospora sp. CPCC 205556 TaxID=3122398 RepID=UPI002FF2C0B8